ncbi:hypothetical protein [Streptomyces sp. NPDC048172]|uniref:hypothetical protein n=1 Tax=Streptomyces sp. NPDC048172 TaxID=3365505 RepID=UPI003715EAE1
MRRLTLAAALWFLPAVLLLAGVALALTDVQANEDPADPTATVAEQCGSVLFPLPDDGAADRHTRICEPARSAHLTRTVLFLAAGTATAALATAVHVRRGRRAL